MTTNNSKYRQMEHIKHIKELPDTYVGSSICEDKELYVYENDKIVKKSILLGGLVMVQQAFIITYIL